MTLPTASGTAIVIAALDMTTVAREKTVQGQQSAADQAEEASRTVHYVNRENLRAQIRKAKISAAEAINAHSKIDSNHRGLAEHSW